MNAAEALSVLLRIAVDLIPLIGTAVLGGLVYSFAWRFWLPRGNWVGRVYCAFILLGTGAWMVLVLLADSALRAQNPGLVPVALIVPSLMFAIHAAALLRPRSRWFVLALSLMAGSLLTSAGLILVGLTPGPTPGHIVGFLIGGGLLWLTARGSLRPYRAGEDAVAAGAAMRDGR